MDGELVNTSQPSDSRGESEHSPQTYTEIFRENFPYYLAVGMTAEQYWDGDPSLTVAYRKAEEIRNEKRNQELWLQGMYIYDAVYKLSPILRAFSKAKEPEKYPSEPYPISEKAARASRKRKEEKENELMMARFESMVAKVNQKFSGGDNNAIGND